MKSCLTTTREPNWKNDKACPIEYPFDETLIATAPMQERDQSRLLIYDRAAETIAHQLFSSVIDFLKPNDLLVVNDTRVFPARLSAQKKSGGKAELLLLQKIQKEGGLYWEALVKGSLTFDSPLILPDGGVARLIRDL